MGMVEASDFATTAMEVDLSTLDLAKGPGRLGLLCQSPATTGRVPTSGVCPRRSLRGSTKAETQARRAPAANGASGLARRSEPRPARARPAHGFDLQAGRLSVVSGANGAPH